MACLPHRRFIGVFTIMFFLQTLFLDAPLVVAGQVDIVDAGSAMAPAAVRAGDPMEVGLKSRPWFRRSLPSSLSSEPLIRAPSRTPTAALPLNTTPHPSIRR